MHQSISMLHRQSPRMILAFTTLWILVVLSFFLPRCVALQSMELPLPWSSLFVVVPPPTAIKRSYLQQNHRNHISQPLKFWKRAPEDVDLDESMILSQKDIIASFNEDAVVTGNNIISMHDANSTLTDHTNSIIEPITNDHSCWFDGKNNRRHRFSSMIVGFVFVPPLFMRLLIPGSKSGSDESSNRMLLQYDDYTNNNASLDRRMNGLQQEQQQEKIANTVANVETSKVVLNGHNSTMVQNSSLFVNNTHFPMEADNYTHFALLESSHYSASSPMTDGGILKRFVRRYFQNNAGNMNETILLVKPKLSKEELDCPIVVTNIDELQNAVLIKKIPLRDVSFRFPTNGIGYDDLIRGPNDTMPHSGKQQQQRGTMFSRHDPAINGTLSSLLTYEAKTSSNPILRANYQHGIDLLSHHPVLSVVRERVKSKSKPGRRLKSSSSDGAHLALVIEGGGMRGAVSAGMAAALSTLDMLDAFDSIHGSSAGAIVGAYLVSRQLCTDVYTDIMPAAGSRFASKRMGVVNFGVDWLDDVIQRKFLSTSSEDGEEKSDEGAVCDDDNNGNATSLYCDDEDNLSSVEMAMNDQSSSRRPRVWHDDPNDGLVLESARYIFSKATAPLSSGVRRVGSVLRPALSAIDFASSLRQYLKRRPGMNLTYILDGVMEETGLRPFDLDAFRSNDKRQPLYVISSTVTNGGKMETVAFNSRDGDFFGIIEDDTKLTISENSGGWYGKIWAIVKFVPYTLLSGARRLLFADKVLSQPIKDEVEAAALPSGTSAMYGFANRRRIRQLSQPQAENKYDPTGRVNDEGKNGLFPCLEASMLVPGIAGPPIQLIRSKNRKFVEQSSRLSRFLARRELNRRKSSDSHVCFDAFCYEPIPYRSAVEKAKATHVLALRTRPDGCIVETRQHLYERVVAPLYFRKHGLGQVAKLFASGKSQYRYIEDVLTLNAGLAHGIEIGKQNQSSSSHGIIIPSSNITYDYTTDIDDRKRAQLLPITLPYGNPELPTLCQDKDEVIQAVRDGYAAAFDILAPIAVLPFDSRTITGAKVAKILFPDADDDDNIAVLDKPVKIRSSYIGEDEEAKRISFSTWVARKREARRRSMDEKMFLHPDGILDRQMQSGASMFHETNQSNTRGEDEVKALLAALPGFKNGRLDHIADALLTRKRQSMDNSSEEEKEDIDGVMME